MPLALAPNQTQERKIYRLFNEGYEAQEIASHLGITLEGILRYAPDYEKPEPEVVKQVLEERMEQVVVKRKMARKKKKKPGRKTLAKLEDSETITV